MSNHPTLIPIFLGDIDSDTVQLVNARNLHQFIESSQDFSTWIKSRINDYSFIENVDYLLHKFMEQLPSGAKHKIDYHITIDMAKELAMVERNDKGKQARRYFIDCEKRLLESPKTAVADNPAAIHTAAPTRLALLKEITSNTTRFINSNSSLERETLAISLCEMNRMAGFADRLNGQIMAELSATPFSDQRTGDVLATFWQHYATLSAKEPINHSIHKDKIAINLRYFVLACEREGLALCNTSELRRALKLSKMPLFVDSNMHIWSGILNKTVPCIVFKGSVK